MVALVVTIGCLALVGCGGGSSSNSSSTSGTPAGKVVHGGQLTFLSSSDIDSIDPGRICTPLGANLDDATSLTLYYIKPGSSDLIPNLASSQPIYSDGGKTITIHIRPNVKYAPPLTRTVQSGDIKYAVEREFTKQVANCAASLFFGSVVGIPKAGGDYKPISGIQTPDKSTVVFHLTKPLGGGYFPQFVLASPFTAPVPPEVAKPLDQKNPTQYGTPAHLPAASGPYMVQTDQPGRQVVLVRNPNWDASASFLPAALDRIVVSEGNSDLNVASRRALAGSGYACCDITPPGPVIAQAARTKDQLLAAPAQTQAVVELPPGGPLRDINIRKAVIAAMDRKGLQLSLGGLAVSDPAIGFIPPTTIGYTASQGTSFDWNNHIAPNLAVAKTYMLKAKADGLPVSADGQYTGSESVTVLGKSSPPASQAVVIMGAALRSLGFHVTERQSDSAYNALYTAAVPITPKSPIFVVAGGPANGIQGFGPLLGIDLPHFSAEVGAATVKRLNDQMTATATTIDRTAQAAGWEKLNEAVLQLAIYAPYAFPKSVVVMSKDTAGVVGGMFPQQGIDFLYSHKR